MTDLRKAAEEAAKVLANALSIDFNDKRDWYSYKHDVEYAANLLRQALAQPANKSDCGHTEYKPFCQMCLATKQKHEGRITALEVRVAKLEKPMTDREKELLAGQRSLLRTAPPSKQSVN